MNTSLTSIAAKLYERITSGVKTVSRGLLLSGLAGLTGLIGSCGGGGGGDDGKKQYWIRVLDSQGNPVQGAKVSLYDASVYDIDTDAGDVDALKPKAQPDGITNADGSAYFRFSDDQRSDVVIASPGRRTYRAFKLNNAQTANSPNWEEELDDDDEADGEGSEEGNGNVTFFGHIKHDDGFPQGGNKYVIGEYVKFLIKGVNKSTVPATASYKVYRDLPGPNDPLVYAGSLANPSESITADAQGNPNAKPQKSLDWFVDAASITTWGVGKYKIKAYWYKGTVEKQHNIGELFVEQDTTPPTIYSTTSYERFTDQTLDLGFTLQDTPQPGTVRAAFVETQSVGTGTVNVDLDTAVDSSGDGDPANDADVVLAGSPGTLPARGEVLAPLADVGKNAKSYSARLWTQDSSGNTGFADMSETVFVTKAEAGLLADPIYDWFKIGPNWDINCFTDFIIGTTKTPTVFNVLCDKINTTYQVGHNYNRQGGLTENQANELEAVISAKTGPEYVKPILKDTKAGFTNTLTNYCQDLKDTGYLPP